jgi:hypothetical protein
MHVLQADGPMENSCHVGVGCRGEYSESRYSGGSVLSRLI